MKAPFPAAAAAVPYLTTAQMVEVDRAMMEDYRIDLTRMMENAGRCLAIVARDRFLGGAPERKSVVVMAGSGGNGGGTLVAARRLHNWGADLTVLLSQQAEHMTLVTKRQHTILTRMGVSVGVATTFPTASTPDIVIDGLIGYSLKGAPRGLAHDLIIWANDCEAPILALDTPSGIDTSTGTVFDPAIRATATMTLALPKEGLRTRDAADHVGELYLADISVPPELYAGPGLGIDVGPIFARSDVIRLL